MTDLPVADIQMIQRIIPQRYPFLLLDRVEEINGFDSCVGIKNVTMNEPHFQGHFPGFPVMPGVTIIEAMAQTGATMVGYTSDMMDKNMGMFFLGVENCKFRRQVVPGDRLELHMTRLRGKPGAKVWKLRGLAKVGEEVAAEADLTAMMVFPE